MTTLEAHARLALWRDRSALDAIAPELRYVPVWPALAAGAAVCSGQLGECKTDDDLREAIRHCTSLFSAGVIRWEDVRDAGLRVINDVLDFGDEQMRARFERAAKMSLN